jgi:hypothetical protein
MELELIYFFYNYNLRKLLHIRWNAKDNIKENIKDKNKDKVEQGEAVVETDLAIHKNQVMQLLQKVLFKW